MKDAWAYVLKGAAMVDGAVSLVPFPLPTRVFSAEIYHDPVTMDLRHNRGSCDTEIVAVGSFGGQNPASEIAGVDVIGDDHRSWNYQRPGSRRHGKPRRLEDVDAIDQLRPDLAHHPPCAAVTQSCRDRVSTTGAQELGIPHFTIVRNLFECCCADDHRPSERSSAYLIDSNNRVRTKEEIPIFGTEDVDSRCHNCD